MDSPDPTANPPIPRDLLAAGDPRFVAALRGVTDSAELARFAADWYADRRPEARELMFAYLAEPPNAPGHEGLIKRLFKLAEGAADDAVMARFLVLGDRLIDRRRPAEDRHLQEDFATLAEAQARGLEWITLGYINVSWSERFQVYRGRTRRYPVTGREQRTSVAAHATTLPRSDQGGGEALAALTAEERARRRWFSVATRRYLQRRIWRYFRTLGRTDPVRYLAAAETALGLVEPAEVGDGLALLDHFGLMHLLFEQSPVLRFKGSGCDLAPRQTLAALAPAPAFEATWRDHPAAVVRVLSNARSVVVARWAIRRIEADRARFLALVRPAAWVDLLGRADPAVVGQALAMLGGQDRDQLRREVGPAAWVRAVEAAAPEHQPAVCDFVGRLVDPADVSRADAVRLAISRFEAPSRLGWGWIEGQGVATAQPGADDDADARALLGLLDARFGPLRPRIVRAVRLGLAARAEVRGHWVGAMLASRHPDVRREGWAWFAGDEAFRANPDLWARLVESPHPDIRAACATVLGPVPIPPERLDSVRAAVLLQPIGAARIKPGVIRRLIGRLEALPPDAEVDEWVALLAAVARSSQAPERRAALAALVTLADRRAGWSGRIEAAVPALQLGARSAILPA